MTTNAQKVKIERLLAVHYVHPQLDDAHRFFTDFGFHVARRDENKIFYRGFGPDPYVYVAEQSRNGAKAFIGGIWKVASRDDLERATRDYGASTLGPCDAPGGGNYVELTDPNGAKVTLVHGIHTRSSDDQVEERPLPVVINSWENKPRKGEFQRPEGGPSKVHKLGHYGVNMHGSKYEETVAWYLNTFNLVLTDAVFNPKTGEDIMSFAHIDLGEEYSDHHSLFFHHPHEPTNGPQAHHSSFEVDNFDSELMGHYYLQKQGWKICWGVGRHLLGSQIFDYWFDASGFIVEHYSDGDLVNCHTGYERKAAGPGTMATWGPDPSRAFMTGRVEDLVEKPKEAEIQRKAVAA